MDAAPDQTITTSNYPELHLLCWNRAENTLSRKDAFALYESHWHMLCNASLTEDEAKLINELAEQFGQGLINA